MLVDEYQDVNPGQLDLIAHFVAAGVKLWAVGDDDQTLYAFRASDIRTILDFGRHHPGARIHTLEVNYRAGAAIVAAAKALIRHNCARVDKDYRSVISEPGEIVIRGYSSPEIEAKQVAAAIADLLGQGEASRRIAREPSGSISRPRSRKGRSRSRCAAAATSGRALAPGSSSARCTICTAARRSLR
jgi:DNA helicase-2/ATP-dependent DNA helicase PcrA